MKHQVRRVDIAIGPGSHDIGVAVRAVELYKEGTVPRLLFTGTNAPKTVKRFSRGEAVHYREHALEHGVPDEAILIEIEARNTAENFTLSRKVLHDNSVQVSSAILISRLCQESVAPTARAGSSGPNWALCARPTGHPSMST